MIKRTLSSSLKRLAAQFPVVALTGPRQSGKTSLVKIVFPHYEYVNMEDLEMRAFAINDPKGFFAQYHKGLIIDEAQHVPSLFSYMQVIVDQTQKAGQFIVTGSQNFMLAQTISQSLAGRIAILQLLPFSIQELKNTMYESSQADAYLFKGLYPRIYDKKLDPLDWYPNYIQTYLERDVRLLKNIGDLTVFQKFIKLCAGRIGQVLNLSSLGNDCGITHNTAKAWLSLLQASYIVYLLKPYYINFNKRLLKMPKLYFFDTGLACSLLGIQSKEQLVTHYLKGSIFESMIISEVIKARWNQARQEQCYYWRDKSGNEIDCLMEKENRVLAIEIKAAATIVDDFFQGLHYWEKIADKKAVDKYLVYTGAEQYKRAQVQILNWKDISSFLA